MTGLVSFLSLPRLTNIFYLFNFIFFAFDVFLV